MKRRFKKKIICFVLIIAIIIASAAVVKRTTVGEAENYSKYIQVAAEDKNISAKKMIKNYADENGYCVDGGGSLWTLMSEGAQKLGIDSTELPLDKQRVINNLEVGNPVVCIMGPGDFTKKGHFIVMTGIENGKIKINDPNSIENSNKLWNFDDISSQINNLWAMRV